MKSGLYDASTNKSVPETIYYYHTNLYPVCTGAATACCIGISVGGASATVETGPTGTAEALCGLCVLGKPVTRFCLTDTRRSRDRSFLQTGCRFLVLHLRTSTGVKIEACSIETAPCGVCVRAKSEAYNCETDTRK
ncbi:hypothetical protein DPMN_142835 [Dreissena polymorpha]|uniref:Uncharacterized protein n=1 Tax=Dreissena polymorpha TaxID=45954 RepID=A0A9D4JL46_DREPO|nr:hypothetical protein DPMN_142835 [Dreissena polymorpha]